MKNVSFTVNQYDQDGDKFNDGVFIYIDENTLIRFKDLDELYNFKDQIEQICTEIEDSIPEE